MPTDACAGRILSDEHLLELVAVKVRELCRVCTDLQYEIGDLLSLLELSNVKVIAPAERNCASFA